ncbi:hypothetical protein HPB51_011503 [Rhipicephalus microplus]|uniref:Uncharacterized protein n=1 Tax=Rhipicephalus microplus TaxID=6941 RepID=A0A9J6D9P6_RHIMP|nr:hypothetical protein HPB51_011503 [Rhipicephalus microplus]
MASLKTSYKHRDSSVVEYWAGTQRTRKITWQLEIGRERRRAIERWARAQRVRQRLSLEVIGIGRSWGRGIPSNEAADPSSRTSVVKKGHGPGYQRRPEETKEPERNSTLVPRSVVSTFRGGEYNGPDSIGGSPEPVTRCSCCRLLLPSRPRTCSPPACDDAPLKDVSAVLPPRPPHECSCRRLDASTTATLPSHHKDRHNQ